MAWSNLFAWFTHSRSDTSFHQPDGLMDDAQPLDGKLPAGAFESDDLIHQSGLPSFNIDGSPMVGMVDINGNPYGITSSLFDDD